MLKCLFSFYYVVAKEFEKCVTQSIVCEAKNLNPRGQSNESLLHLSVSNSSTILRTGAEEPEPSDMFPCEDVVKYLLEAGYDPNVKSEAGETLLHVTAKKVRKNLWKKTCPAWISIFGCNNTKHKPCRTF